MGIIPPGRGEHKKSLKPPPRCDRQIGKCFTPRYTSTWTQFGLHHPSRAYGNGQTQGILWALKIHQVGMGWWHAWFLHHCIQPSNHQTFQRVSENSLFFKLSQMYRCHSDNFLWCFFFPCSICSISISWLWDGTGGHKRDLIAIQLLHGMRFFSQIQTRPRSGKSTGWWWFFHIPVVRWPYGISWGGLESRPK